MPVFESAASVVSLAARELGLVSADITDPYASADPNILQMTSLLTSAGREIVRERRWSQSIQEHSFATVQGTSTYALPADMMRMVPQTWWNRTNRLPVGGPLDAEEWQYLKGTLVGVVFNVFFRVKQGQLVIYPDTNTPGGYTIAFEYMSSNWVAVAGSTTGTKYAPTAKDDVLLFDTHLMSRALKRAFLRAKGFDTTAVEEDYEKALAMAMDDDSPGRTLDLVSGRSVDPLIGQQNVPLTGFGS